MRRTGPENARGHWVRASTIAAALIAAAVAPIAYAASGSETPVLAEAGVVPEGPASVEATAVQASAPAGGLERIRASGAIRLGYVDGARPFSYRDPAGNAAGYTVALCQRIVDAAKVELAMPELEIEWVLQSFDQRFTDVQEGRVDVECAAGVATLAAREKVSFSIPVFPGSVGALLRRDASSRLKELLEEGPPRFRPFWRAAPAQILGEQTFAAIPGTPAEGFLAERASTLRLTSTVVSVADVAAGVQSVLDRESDVLFADRALLLDAARNHPAVRDLTVLDRKFTYQPIALGVARGEEDVRLLVDRTLSRLYRGGELAKVYEASFGEPDEATLNFFKLSVLPE